MHDRTTAAEAVRDPSPWLVLWLAVACGVTVANIYYAQPLAGPIGESFGFGLEGAGLIVTTMQLGYVLGLIFLAPLGDLVENKSLILTTLGALLVSLAIAALAPNAIFFIAASALLGIATTGTQMILPVAAHLAPERSRGQIVGTVMSGLLFGILLARPLATMIAGPFGWRTVYWLSAAAMSAVTVLMALALPRRKPVTTLSYRDLIASLWNVLVNNPVLQRRAFYQAMLFGAFSLFWTAMPLILQAPPFSLGHLGLSAFLLSGVAGAFVAPLAGRWADRGYGNVVSGSAMVTVTLSFVVAWFGSAFVSIATLVIAGVLLDVGAQANMVCGQRSIYTLPAAIRSRLNALYLAIFFFGGALGSALSGYAVARGGAAMVCAIGFAFGLTALIAFTIEMLRTR